MLYTWFTPSIFASLALVEGLVNVILLNVWSPHNAYLRDKQDQYTEETEFNHSI